MIIRFLLLETLTLLIPNFYGGASSGELSEKSKTYEAIKRAPNAKKIIKQLPLYWGSQPITSGPTYVGSIVVFLFVLGLFIVCLLYTSPSPRDVEESRMPSSA